MAPSGYSGGLEEYIIRDFFKDERDGSYVDVGAYHAREGSNTYRLERDFGWSGLAIDANPAFAPEYQQWRPRTKYIVAFIGRTNGGEATLNIPDAEDGAASGDAAFAGQFGPVTRTLKTRRRTLDSLLEERGITAFDFLSMDIETGEPDALSGFAIERYHPRLVCIEAHPSVRQRILDYFTRAHYVLIGDYVAADPLNYYFRPL